MSLITASRHKEPWGRFALKALIVSVVSIAIVSYLSDRYRIARDIQQVRSLGEARMFLIDRYDRTPVRGELMAFEARGLAPYFDDGTLMGKRLVGMPGDKLRVDRTGVWINDVHHAIGFMHRDDLNLTESDLYRNEIIPPERYFFLASAPESYDSRYWGYVEASQLKGHVYTLY